MFLQNQLRATNTITEIIACKSKILDFNQNNFIVFLTLYNCPSHHNNRVLEVNFNGKLINDSNDLSIINHFVSFSWIYFNKFADCPS